MEIAIEYLNLFRTALKTTELAYAPYSKFRVGAALLLPDGSVVTGVNVENRSFGLTNCAERSAIYSAISSGIKEFTALAIATPDADYPVSPCGACRQVMSEFMDDTVPVIFGASENNLILSSISKLFPFDALHELSEK